ncbi:MAG: TonB-dependent receptor [Alcanivorax sp.]|nr:TonB-dependent receptor [Alcanivorax sp.]
MWRIRMLAVAGGCLVVTGVAMAEEASPANSTLDQVTIIGSEEDRRFAPGSAFQVTREDLERFEYSDIHRMLDDVPGVYIQEEDGFGLRPNIGIRGAGPERTSKITVMEDGVLVAPAPYADPAAYYFPTAGRMSGLEVLKGPNTLRYGPYTVGGALNLQSTPIPATSGGRLTSEMGNFGNQKTHIHYGGTEGQWGYLIEGWRQNADGFQDIDRSNRDTGLAVEDYVAKLRWRSAPDAALAQQLDFKVQYSEEASNFSYVGLTDEDFKRDARRRYGLTELDQITNRHRGYSIRHQIALGLEGSLATTLYRNDFYRNWYKVDRIEGQGVSGYLADANIDPLKQDVLRGDLDATDIRVKNNARDYYAQGIQFEYSDVFYTGDIRNDWLVGTRLHEDEVDRFQPIDVFNQENGSLVYQSTTFPGVGGGDNRVGEADATSVWALNRMSFDRLQLTGSLRYENIKTKETRFDDVDRTISNVTARARTEEVMAGLGATYAFNERVTLLAGIHQGFAPAGAGADDDEDPEKSVNYELGMRLLDGNRSLDVIGFLSDYSNAVQNCSVANPCPDAAVSGTYQLGESEVYGLELAFRDVVYEGAGFVVPAGLTYTWTKGEITRDSDNGDVFAGDPLPYVAEHIGTVFVGVEHGQGWKTFLSARYSDSVCINNDCDRVNDSLLKTDSYVTLNLAASYALTPAAEVYVKVENLLDEEAIAARSPAGARVNMPRYAGLGVRLSF